MALLDSQICDFGWKAPSFELADPGGVWYSLNDLMGERGLLIVFMCNHCPYVIAVIDRLAADARVLQEAGVNVVGIMSNDYDAYPADAPEAMTAFAKQHALPFPYLVDEDQAVARAYDAICTPDFFGLNADGDLQYRGRLDDARAQADATDRVPELVNAMIQIAETSEGPAEQTSSMGCSIKWKAA